MKYPLLYFCFKCQKKKKALNFSPGQLKVPDSVCKTCRYVYSYNIPRRDLEDAKVKVCLKCDLDFVSLCDYRLCNLCGQANAKIDGEVI